MHIKKLEICGFKSFVDRTVIHFDHDMIGVVGPNGCGKSNVVDAIRWSMGEQSAKSLRGRAMADVIFSGSETRQHAGFAEVTITFDNSGPEGKQSLPLEYRDYSEIAVTRRLHRGDGSNDYFINKVPVRLRDVTEVFLGTGVGRKAYSIVEQGKIGMIVSARPTDRRVLIEEAAGITKYKARKRQAENKMELTRQNLSRVTDIVGEIERQIGSLKRQSAKATRYVRYREELDDLMLWDAAHRWLGLTATSQVAERDRVIKDEAVRAERTEVGVRDAEIEVMRQQSHQAETTAEQAQNEAFMSDNEVREHETSIDRASDRYQVLCQSLQRAKGEQVDVEVKAQNLAAERESLQTELQKVATELEREETVVATELTKLEAYERETQAAEQLLTTAHQRDARAAAHIAASAASIEAFERRHGELGERAAKLQLQLTEIDLELSALDERRSNLSRRADELVSRKHAMCDARDALAGELPKLKQEVAESDSEHKVRQAELDRTESRLRALQELAQRMEGIGAGVRNLLKTGDASLGGLIVDRVEVPAELTQAFAGLVGERIQCVVVDDLDRGLTLLDSMAKGGEGRVTIMAREIARSKPTDPFFVEQGVVGPLVDQLRFSPADEGIVRALVGGAVLVETHDVARNLLTRGIEHDVVALDGTVFHCDGRITGGSGDGFAAGIIEQKREMRELEDRLEELRAAADQSSEQLDALRERAAGMLEALDQAKTEAHEAEIAMVNGQQELKRLGTKIASDQQTNERIRAELDDVERSLATAEQERIVLEQQRAEAQAECEMAAQAQLGAEAQALQCRQQLADQQAVCTDRKVLMASVTERASAARDALARVQTLHAELLERIETLEDERSEAAIEAGGVAASLFLSREEMLISKRRSRQAHSSFEAAKVELDDARHALALREAELREMRNKLGENTTALQELEMQLQRLTIELEHLEEAIAERFRGLELRTVVGDFHARAMMSDEQQRRIKELAQLIDRMGSVNLDAMKEFEEASERFEFYTTQRADLEEALTDLEKAIGQMNRESRRLFKHAFEGINRRFKDIFPKMFRGGRAELRLTDPDDMLETGIDILAQPPGKKLGNLELMSGGEKAFTAVSLLLAIFRFKPSPFCILDEVDAPLDEANVERYVEGIRAMTDRSQFIVITHSKRTMQAVDVLYGVTMQEPGVSKLVGVRVGNATARSKARSEAPPATEATPEAAHAVA